MSKSLKLIILTLVVALIAVVLGHGVVVPKFVWESRLLSIQNQYPDQRINLKRIVLAMSLNPKLLLSEITIDDPTRQEKVELGLLRLGFGGIESVKQGRLQINSIALKGLTVQAEKKGDCTKPTLDCLPVIPVALAARGWQSTQVANPDFMTPQLALKSIELEQATFSVNNTNAQQQLNGKVEQFKFLLGETPSSGQFNLGWQLSLKAPAVNNQIYIALKAQPAQLPSGEVVLTDLKADIDGDWGGFPWTATAEQTKLALGVQQANGGEGAPILAVSGENLRTYIRRNDLPETHQAAFSALSFQGGLPAQNWALNKAEWTYTHEDAQAWTFNMNYLASGGLLSIVPETIQGSEGIPAERQVRELNCETSAEKIREDKPYWAWQEGWFRVLNEHPGLDDGLVFCPVRTNPLNYPIGKLQQPSEGAAFVAAVAVSAAR